MILMNLGCWPSVSSPRVRRTADTVRHAIFFKWPTKNKYSPIYLLCLLKGMMKAFWKSITPREISVISLDFEKVEKRVSYSVFCCCKWTPQPGKSTKKRDLFISQFWRLSSRAWRWHLVRAHSLHHSMAEVIICGKTHFLAGVSLRCLRKPSMPSWSGEHPVLCSPPSAPTPHITQIPLTNFSSLIFYDY